MATSSSIPITLKAEGGERLAPLRVTLPPSWLSKPCGKLLSTWRKKHGGPPRALVAGDGTPIPEDWPIEGVVELYGAVLWVRDREAEDFMGEADDAYRLGEYDEAVAAYSKILESKAKTSLARRAALSNRAAAYAMVGDDVLAAKDCDAALAEEGGGWEKNADVRRDKIRLRAARCRLRLGDVARAEELYAAVLRDGAAARGDCSDEAAALSSEAARGEETARDCGRNLRAARRELEKGLFDSQGGDRARCRAAFLFASKARDTAPKATEAAALAFRSLCALRDWPKAFEFFENSRDLIHPKLRSRPGALDRQVAGAVLKAVGYHDLTRVDALLSDWQSAFPASRDWIDERTRAWADLRDLKHRADEAFGQRHFSAAAEAYRAAAALDPDFPALAANLAAALKETGHDAAAARACLDAINAQPLYPKVRLRRARCLAASGNDESAADEYANYLADCDYAGVKPDPNAKAELDALRQRSQQRHQHTFAFTDDEERSFFERYRDYARRFAANNRRRRHHRSGGEANDNKDTPGAPSSSESSQASAYAILGVAPSTSPPDLKRRYRDLVLKYHPDKSTDPNAEDKFREIHEAYHSLVG